MPKVTVSTQSATIVRSIGQEWMRPGAYWECDSIPYAGAVAVGGLDAGEDFEEGGLARAVGPDEGEAFAFLDGEANAREEGAGAKCFGEALGCEDGGHERGRYAGGRGRS